MLKFNKIFKHLSNTTSSFWTSSFSKLPSTIYRPQSYAALNNIYQPKQFFSSFDEDFDDEFINLIIVNRNKEEIPIQARVGDSVLHVIQKSNIFLEGACDSSIACCTCHVILDDKVFESVPAPNVSEEDVLDIAIGLTKTSRLGCQIRVTKDFEGCKISIPEFHRDFWAGNAAA